MPNKKKKDDDKEYLEPQEASKIVNGGDPPYKVPETNGNGNGNGGDKDAKAAELLGSTKEVIALKRAELKSELALRKVELKEKIDTIKAQETAKEKAGKHLAVFGAFYLCILVLAFLVSVKYIDGENLAIVATLITLVVTSLSSILKGISDTPEPKDPVELMHDIVQRQLSISNEEEK